jgi:hypothetical protein
MTKLRNRTVLTPVKSPPSKKAKTKQQTPPSAKVLIRSSALAQLKKSVKPPATRPPPATTPPQAAPPHATTSKQETLQSYLLNQGKKHHESGSYTEVIEAYSICLQYNVDFKAIEAHLFIIYLTQLLYGSRAWLGFRVPDPYPYP